MQFGTILSFTGLYCELNAIKAANSLLHCILEDVDATSGKKKNMVKNVVWSKPCLNLV